MISGYHLRQTWCSLSNAVVVLANMQGFVCNLCPCLEYWCIVLCILLSRGYYIVVVPLKKQRPGKFLKPWDNPDEMNLEEVRKVQIWHFKFQVFFCYPVIVVSFLTGSTSLCAHAPHFLSQSWKKASWGSWEGRRNSRWVFLIDANSCREHCSYGNENMK